MNTKIIASDGKEIEMSTRPEPYGGCDYGYPVPLMRRDESRANTTITVGQWELSYDSLGYCYKRVKK